MKVRDCTELIAWQKAMVFVTDVYKASENFPQRELYGLSSQLRRAAVSIPSNIAEGQGRENRGDYIQFLRVAQGSLKELETHLILSHRVKLTTVEDVEPLLAQCEAVGKMLRALIRSLQSSRK